MNDFFNNHIIIETNFVITAEEESEILDLAQQVLTRNKEGRIIKAIIGFETRKI